MGYLSFLGARSHPLTNFQLLIYLQSEAVMCCSALCHHNKTPKQATDKKEDVYLADGFGGSKAQFEGLIHFQWHLIIMAVDSRGSLGMSQPMITSQLRTVAAG